MVSTNVLVRMPRLLASIWLAVLPSGKQFGHMVPYATRLVPWPILTSMPQPLVGNNPHSEGCRYPLLDNRHDVWPVPQGRNVGPGQLVCRASCWLASRPTQRPRYMMLADVASMPSTWKHCRSLVVSQTARVKLKCCHPALLPFRLEGACQQRNVLSPACILNWAQPAAMEDMRGGCTRMQNVCELLYWVPLI